MLVQVTVLICLIAAVAADEQSGALTDAAAALNGQKDSNQQAVLKLLANSTKTGLQQISRVLGNQWNGSDSYIFVPEGYSHRNALPLMVYLPSRESDSYRDLEAFNGLIGLQNVGAIFIAPQPRRKTGWSGDEDTSYLDNMLRDLFQVVAVDPRKIAFGGYADGATAALAWGANNEFVSTLIAYSPTSNPIIGDAKQQPRIYVSFGDRDTARLDDMHRAVDVLKKEGYEVEMDEFAGDEMVPDTVLQASFQWWATGSTQ